MSSKKARPRGAAGPAVRAAGLPSASACPQEDSHRWATGLHVRQLAAGCSDGQSWPPKARRNCEQSLGLALLMCCRALGNNRSTFPLRVGGLSSLRHRVGDSQIGGGGCSPPHHYLINLLPMSPAPYSTSPQQVPTAGSEDSRNQKPVLPLRRSPSAGGRCTWWIISDRVSRGRTGDTEAPKEMSAQEGLSEKECSCQ